MTHLIIGLGNPGKEYQGTRHNIGRDTLFEFAEKNNFPTFSENKKFNALISEGNLAGKKVVLLLPNTFMNLSGDAVLKAINFFKVTPENIFIVHDDVDINFPKTKLCFDKNSGGQKGVEDIIQKIGTKKFYRFKIGINSNKIKKPAKSVVLKKFSIFERLSLGKVKEKTNQALLTSLSDSPEKAMGEFNKYKS